jgi:hypothetical protein
MTAGADTAGNAPTGSSTPVYNSVSGQYEYLVTRYYKLNLVDNLIIYRLIIASTAANLTNSNCSFITSSPKIIHAVNCYIVLSTTLISFKGQVREGLSALQWLSANETTDITYIVERSDDGSNFTPIGWIKGMAGAGQGASYHFTDPNPPAAQSYYRLNITGGDVHRYSNQLLLGTGGINFDIRSLVNPFTD